MNEELLILLNSYLDGQLNAGQRQKVEERLATDTTARQLLADLRQVSAQVARLPRAAAPADLAERVYAELEREALLGHEEHAELQGRNHLFLRRFIAAAAMLALASAVALFVFYTLSGGGSKPLGSEPPIAMAPTGGDPLKNLNDILRTPPPVSAPAVAVPEHPEPVFTADVAQPAYNRLRLLLNIPAPQTARGQLRNLLDDHAIGDVQYAQPDGRHEYAFLCTLDQLQSIAPLLAGIAPAGVDLAGPDSDVPLFKSIQPVQILAVARARTLEEYLQLESGAGADPGLLFAQNLFLDRHLAGLEPAPGYLSPDLNVRILGPEDMQSAAVPAHSLPAAPAQSASASAASELVEVTLLLQPAAAPEPEVSPTADPNP